MKLERLHNILQWWLQRLLILLMAAMALDVLWQITTRFLIGDPWSFASSAPQSQKSA